MRRVNKQINEADAETKSKSMSYADQRRGAKQPNFKVGDQVLVRQQKRNKLTSKFNPRPYQIIKIKATMITARLGGTPGYKKLFPFQVIYWKFEYRTFGERQ